MVTVIFFAAASDILLAAEPQLPPSKRNAPKGQQIEFSSVSSTAPELPKPAPRAAELQNRQGFVKDNNESGANPGSATPPPAQPPAMSKALADRMLQQLDRRKNWMVPGAQDAELSGMMSEWMKQGFEKNDKETDDEKKESVMERFLKGTDQKNKRRNDQSRGGPDDRKDNDNSRDDDAFSNSKRDPKSESPSGVSDFSLKGALTSEHRKEGFAPREMSRQNMFRPDFNQENRTGRERELAKEREATRAAEFQQLLRPRSASPTFSSITDPINSAPDLTRREFNPTLPRISEPAPRPEASSFGAPQLPRSYGAQDRGLFGVTVPSAPSFSPAQAPAPQLPATTFRPSTSIILEPPKRPY